MMIVHGLYKWFPKLTAFRRDFCRNCETEVLAVRRRTFSVLHLYWIPLAPLGVWNKWHCTVCGCPAHENTRTRKGFVVTILIVLIVFTFFLSFAYSITGRDWPMAVLFRFVLPVTLGILLTRYVNEKKEPDFCKALAAVKPFSGYECPLCGSPLVINTLTRCVSCGAVHLPLQKKPDNGT